MLVLMCVVGGVVIGVVCGWVWVMVLVGSSRDRVRVRE